MYFKKCVWICPDSILKCKISVFCQIDVQLYADRVWKIEYNGTGTMGISLQLDDNMVLTAWLMV